MQIENIHLVENLFDFYIVIIENIYSFAAAFVNDKSKLLQFHLLQ